MAIKSFLLSVVLTIFFGYSFTVGLTTKDSFIHKIPEWGGFVVLIGGGILYLLAFWWGIKGFPQHKFLSLMSLGLSGFGIACYALVISMELNRGKPTPGQFDYDLGKIPAQEQVAVRTFAKQIGIQENEIHITEFWKLYDFPLAVCIQKGHVIGIGTIDKPISDVSVLSDLTELSALYLRNARLKDLSGLKLSKLHRLELQGNHFTDLKSFSGIPNLEWLFMEKNDLTRLDGIEQMPKLKEKNFYNNPLPENGQK